MDFATIPGYPLDPCAGVGHLLDVIKRRARALANLLTRARWSPRKRDEA